MYKRQPQDILSIIDFAYNKIGGKLLIVLADCIGYYSNKDIKAVSYTHLDVYKRQQRTGFVTESGCA